LVPKSILDVNSIPGTPPPPVRGQKPEMDYLKVDHGLNPPAAATQIKATLDIKVIRKEVELAPIAKIETFPDDDEFEDDIISVIQVFDDKNSEKSDETKC
jgi:hypothetical protein